MSEAVPGIEVIEADPELKIAFLTALAEAQIEFPPVPKTALVKVYPKDKSKKPYMFRYATLEDILSTIRPVLSRHGFSLEQRHVTDTTLRTTLWHKTGQSLWTENVVAALVQFGANYQAYGSMLSYVRRYQVSTLLCISSTDDDDGNIGAGNDVETAAAPVPAEKKPATFGDRLKKMLLSVQDAGDLDQLRKIHKRCQPLLAEIKEKKPEAYEETYRHLIDRRAWSIAPADEGPPANLKRFLSERGVQAFAEANRYLAEKNVFVEVGMPETQIWRPTGQGASILTDAPTSEAVLRSLENLEAIDRKHDEDTVDRATEAANPQQVADNESALGEAPEDFLDGDPQEPNAAAEEADKNPDFRQPGDEPPGDDIPY